MGLLPNSWGQYPPEYNREIHGPYNPGMYYGKRDTPLSEVKLGELMSWFSRRSMSPSAMAAAISRAWYRYQINWVQCRRPGPASVYQILAVSVIFNYWLDYNRLKAERKYRYH